MKTYGPYQRKDGRMHVCIIEASGKRKTKSYPRIVMEEKIGRPLLEEETVDHIDGNFLNNSLENLRILSRSENAAWGWKTGNCKAPKMTESFRGKRQENSKGEKNSLSKLSQDQVAEIRKRERYYGCIKDWMAEFKVSRKTIFNILKNISYVT